MASSVPGPEVLAQLPPSAVAALACECAATGDIEGMRSLVRAESSAANAGTPYDRRTPLHLAAAAGNTEMVRFLMEECGANQQRDRFGLLPIHDAVENGHNEVRRFLQGRSLGEEAFFADAGARRRLPSGSYMNGEEAFSSQAAGLEESMSTVFELIVKEGIFSYNTVHAEVQHFFKGLGLHPIYFEHFTPMQVAKHIHCLIAAKRVARATDNVGMMRFAFEADRGGFFLAAIDSPEPTEAQKRTEEKVAAYLEKAEPGKDNVSLTFMSSVGPAFQQGKERLGIWSADRNYFDTTANISEDETSIEVLASTRFLRRKTKISKAQYQLLMDDVVASRRSVVRVVEGSVYPGPYPGGFVMLFGTAETVGRHYFLMISHAMRFVGITPRRFYCETFANGVITYSLFFPSAKESDMQKLERTVMYSTLLKSIPGRSLVIFNSVMQSKISHEVGLYLMAGVKFVYQFFPKERYARQYTDLHKLLERDQASQRKLEDLYKLCMKELLAPERIYDLVQRNFGLAGRFFEDFQAIALGRKEPHFNEQLAAEIDTSVTEPQDRQILRMFLTFNEGLRLTNFFKAEKSGAMSFRLDPRVVLKDRLATMYPEIPYGIYMVAGRDFYGFHVRFRDVARGGIRLVCSRTVREYERNSATLFDECYNLALKQQLKNKDVPEGGAVGVILPDSSWPGAQGGNVLQGPTSQSPVALRSCFVRFVGSILDCMQPEKAGIFSHLKSGGELLYFGPDENTSAFMDLGATLARKRGHPFWKALFSNKSERNAGVPQEKYAMTTASIHTYVAELLKELNEDEESITKVQTGGPTGVLGSNEILSSKDRTIAIVDGSGVLYDPAGLNREELRRLAVDKVSIREFSQRLLGKGGFLVTIDQSNVRLPDGSHWRTGAELRDSFHFTDFAQADLFMPCGGRPNSVSSETVKNLFTKDGKPKFRMVVEGANLYLSDLACTMLERAGVHVFKDLSTNKGGVNGSSLEMLAALALPPEDHDTLMAYDPEAGGEPPEFRQAYIKQMKDTIVDNSRQEFRAIWTCNKHGIPKVEASRRMSMQINRVKDSFEKHHASMSETERDCLTRSVLRKGAVPPVMLERLGLEGVLRNVPANYVLSMVSAWIASRYVYRYGLDASEVSFFLFLRELMKPGDSEESRSASEAERSRASGEEPQQRPQDAALAAAGVGAAPAPQPSPGMTSGLKRQASGAGEAADCAPAAARMRLGTF